MKRLIFPLILLAMAMLSGCAGFNGLTADAPAIPPSVQKVSDVDSYTGSKVVTDNDGNIKTPGNVVVGDEDEFCINVDGDNDADICFTATVPTSSTSTACTTGDFVIDGVYFYLCDSTDHWVVFTGSNF